MSYTNIPPAVRVPERDPGDWYANREREARELSARIEEARELRNDPEELAYLEKLLDLARYVGD